jgi:hypothetical protein
MSTDNPDQQDEHQTAFSRTGMVAPMGTLVDPLKTFADIDTGAEFRKIANSIGTDTSGLLRDFVYKTVHGKTYTDICLDAAKSKRDLIFGTGTIEALTARGEVKS